MLAVRGSNKRGLVPRIGNIGIDVIFDGDLEVLKKASNTGGALSTTGSGAKAKKKGGRK